jgi:hypothetical protein
VITPSRAIWEVCGSPRVEDCAATPAGSRCWVCAAPAPRGMPREEWMGSGFVGQNRVRYPESGWVCEPCLHIMSRIAPVPGRPPAPGKKFGGNFRNYSHLWEAGRPPLYENASKGEKPRIRAFLAREHHLAWFAAIADSGQKHVIPWAPVNPAGRGGLVLFDEQLVRVPASLALVEELAALLTAGATKDEIAAGSYTHWTWQRCPAAVRAFESKHERERGGAWFALALWLAQRDEEVVTERRAQEVAAKAVKKGKASHGKAERGARREAARADGGGAARDAAHVPGRGGEGAEALGPTPVEDARRSEHDDERGGVGHVDGHRPAAWRAEQLALFGAAEARGGSRARARR